MKNESHIAVATIVGLPDTLIRSEQVDLFAELSAYLNELVLSDFNQLVSILYRMDVSESKVRAALADASGTVSAGEIIARLLIEREQEKMEWRRKFRDGEL
ncbi:hypothetical protein H9Y05_05850 [Crocinitomicaceae bacterium CZZ-1]|uniref:Uncharacterized protein n=1 Tax=Taishania pollutisoli TaxID=2766479 RepID=A0A8J6PBA3_9FLAO|nr:hypothetical protein [Taishania pollutisoli]MBC9811998.1 hypothetical protein [Taishania pollutisoli]MBX2949926.1 hypothetical protein [Crocinitomicaceae bacterium]NGF74845.1 hypothetical protein [Fluviicola sp. SGL-29]